VAVEALKSCGRENIQIMEKLVRCGLCVPLFTEKQKLMILNAAVIWY
jgi:hypothetical protein